MALKLVSPIFTGMTASVLNVKLKGVSPVGVLTVILYAYRTLGISFTQAHFTPLSQALIILSKVQFVTSTYLLDWGCPGDE